VFDRKTGAHLGALDIFVVTRLSIQVANLGYAFHNQYWGKGYAKEAIVGVAQIAFRDLKLHRVEACMEPKNLASVGAARGAGMKHEGTRKRYLHDGKRWTDAEVFVLLSEDLGIKMRPTVRSKMRDMERGLRK
jgi:ribosomal-protein-alanine N-acetyltransferase